MFVHLVFFWLDEKAPAELRQQMMSDCCQLLEPIPGVKAIHWGKPAMTPREVVDNSYDLGMCLLFDTLADHDAYQIHPNHRQFNARHRHFWKKVQVYDFS